MFAYTTLLRGQYEAVKKAWKARPAADPPYTPRQVMDFWIEVAETSPQLGELAQLWWEKPISSAGVERIFSILTHMDDEHRRQMQDKTLYHTLFLRANRRLVEQLVAERAAAERGLSSDAGAASRADAEQEAGAAAAFSALGALSCAASAKRGRRAALVDPVASAAADPSAAGAGLPPTAKRGRLVEDAAVSPAVVEEEDALFSREIEESPGAEQATSAAPARDASGLPAGAAGAGSTLTLQECRECSDCRGVISPDSSCEPGCRAGLRRVSEREEMLAAKRHAGFIEKCLGPPVGAGQRRR